MVGYAPKKEQHVSDQTANGSDDDSSHDGEKPVDTGHDQPVEGGEEQAEE